jgi:saccharopine dehydrogenase (NADP+, L-glutamate forming)
MKHILVIGAGRSSSALIEYLLQHAAAEDWQVTVADMDIRLAQDKLGSSANGTAQAFDIRDDEKRRALISKHDLIISMLPAFMHGDVARDCVELGKHMATASYVSSDMKQLDAEAKKKGLLLLNECGLDPGLDHASAMKVIHHIQAQGGEITSFKSYCGGLVAPASNDNPWGYKFSWNPRNVILAGQGTAQWLEEGELKFIPYNRLFTQINTIEVEGYGKFDAYANRDSISYIESYGLKNIKTMLRGTLRQQNYCKAWNVFVKLGLTDDSAKITNTGGLTYTDLLQSFLPTATGNVAADLKNLMGKEWDADIENMLESLELFSNKKIKVNEGSPAQLLQALLEEKWLLKAGDRDMIVMQHQFEYRLSNGSKKYLESSLVLEGKNEHMTAMAMTVGLPLAITVRNFLKGGLMLSGVQIPTIPSIYNPLLDELAERGISFTETEN